MIPLIVCLDGRTILSYGRDVRADELVARRRTRREAPSRRHGAFARTPDAVDAARSHVVETGFGGRAAQHQRLRPLRLRHADAGRRGRGEAGDLGGGVDVLARAPAAEVFLEMMNAGALLI